MDERAGELWDAYTEARDRMLQRTHTEHAPWTLVRSDRKKRARLGLLRFLLARIDYPGRAGDLGEPDPRLVFPFDGDCLKDGRLAR